MRYSGNGRVRHLRPGAETVLTLWDLPSGKPLANYLWSFTNQVALLALSPDSRTAFVGSADNGVDVFDLGVGEEVRTFSGGSSVTSVAFSPDGLTAISGGLDHKLKLWDLETGQELQTFSGHEGQVTSVAFSLVEAKCFPVAGIRRCGYGTSTAARTSVHFRPPSFVAEWPASRFRPTAAPACPAATTGP